MLGAGLITFRETLEASLVVGIIFSLLTKTNQHIYKKFVWWGIGVGGGFAAILAYVLYIFYGGLSGRMEEIFEGIFMFVTAGFLTWMILWVHRQKDIVINIKRKVTEHTQSGYGLGIFFLTASAVIREGTETVLYLQATTIAGSQNLLWGAFAGMMIALFIGYLIFFWAMRIRFQTVFDVTSVFLLLFAAGLVAHGVHEFQEVGVIPVYSFDPIFNISWLLDHKSTFGSLLRTVFGYTSKPTFLELVSYSSYVAFIFWLERVTDKMIAKK
ncbi:MAG: hypothetical protein A3F31_05585 [Candidatus Levybacteria bacterium RIFCSPHIGHO2_12_FULL_38_12]|nr:MAG: hypothetical protein A2770_00070 [Candidatus Levybacteria bacterium RIFCSPHIGHO2_01_FULL_38_12]OGH23089.1 MAG: hypothetical protein A3F31_05585 [Candidatus Levybacteria bacterium RIFCSPHIGHO2_12_FULL_38_12]OGH33807.1 MAG: hypothetical protein A3A47_02045 [Candidatus Levybacteria bacterium RIFCSPLOWO2_01_FULL_37_20]OGH44782.1 MAG: hypothetical protein A3J14_02305 [Candidatus Levybacteria bacterium RIFCSPLOWO2_02_FULL_37_18]